MRTHVILRDDQRTFLLSESARTGLSIGELVRRALDATYRIRPRPQLAGFELSVGLWRRLDAAVTGRRLRQVDGAESASPGGDKQSRSELYAVRSTRSSESST